MPNRLAEEAAYFAAVDAGRDSAQEEIDRLRAVNAELIAALEEIAARAHTITLPVVTESHAKRAERIRDLAFTAIAHAKAKGQGGE